MRRGISAVVGVLLGLVLAAGTLVPAMANPVTVTAYSAGSKFVGQGTNVWGTASGAPRRPVQVQALVNGRWSTSQKGTTSATGSYVLPLTYGVTTPGTYSFRVVVTLANGTYAVSPVVRLVRVPIRVTAATAGSKFVNHDTNIWGSAGAGAANRPAELQVLHGGRWVTIRHTKTSATGSYVMLLTYGVDTPGVYSYRVKVSTVVGLRYSPVVTLTRTEIHVFGLSMMMHMYPVGSLLSGGRVIDRDADSMNHNPVESNDFRGYCMEPALSQQGPWGYGIVRTETATTKAVFSQTDGTAQAKLILGNAFHRCARERITAGTLFGMNYVGVRQPFTRGAYLYAQYGNIVVKITYNDDVATRAGLGPKTDLPRLLQQLKTEIIRVSKLPE